MDEITSHGYDVNESMMMQPVRIYSTTTAVPSEIMFFESRKDKWEIDSLEISI